jgi:hypothetical protein
MKKLYVGVLIAISLLIINCMPSVVSDLKIESRFSYSSDEDAILGILTDVIKIDYSDFNNYLELIGLLRISMFEEDKRIGNSLKLRYGKDIRMGEVIRVVYKYKNDTDGYDFIYKPYNKDLFTQNLISCYDFVLTLEKMDY